MKIPKDGVEDLLYEIMCHGSFQTSSTRVPKIHHTDELPNCTHLGTSLQWSLGTSGTPTSSIFRQILVLHLTSMSSWSSEKRKDPLAMASKVATASNLIQHVEYG